MAGEQRTTPSSPCAIQLIASRGVSLSAFSCAGPPSSGRTAYGRPAQCTCPPPFAASRPHLRNRGEAIRWPQSYDSHRSRRGNRRRSGPSQSAAGVNRTTSAGDPARNISFFFGHFSRRCQLRTSRKCSKVNSRYVVATFHSSIHPRPTHCARGSRQTRGRCDSDVTVNGGPLACPPLCAVIC